MVYTIKIKNDKYKTFGESLSASMFFRILTFYPFSEDLCQDGLDEIKHYKGRTYPTLPKTLDSIITEWIKNIKCSANEKIFYKNTNSLGTRRYYVERVQGAKPVLKVQIQARNKKQTKKTGRFMFVCNLLSNLVY